VAVSSLGGTCVRVLFDGLMVPCSELCCLLVGLEDGVLLRRGSLMMSSVAGDSKM
jgi:hypothetical protein